MYQQVQLVLTQDFTGDPGRRNDVLGGKATGASRFIAKPPGILVEPDGIEPTTS